MEILKDVAETINPMIKFTIDTPCNYDDGAIPILDLKVKMNPEENNRIDYQFYEKPSRNEKVIMANAAMSTQSIRTILTQECMRRLRNTNTDLGEEVQRRHLDKFMLTLKKSGHSVQFRKQILNSAIKGFEEILEQDRKGVKPLFRNRNWNEKERSEAKKNNKTNWFNKNKGKGKPKIVYKSVLFVPPTPDEELIKEMKQREWELNKNSKERIKFVEKSGTKMENILVKKDPFPVEKCSGKKLESCFVCKSAGNQKLKISCRKNNFGYGLICDTCSERNIEVVYEGESSRSTRIRGNEHLSGYKKKDPKNVIFKHKESNHKYEKMEMKMIIKGTFQDALTRQSNEAVRIQKRENQTLLNSKSEMNHPPLARITVEKKAG